MTGEAGGKYQEQEPLTLLLPVLPALHRATSRTHAPLLLILLALFLLIIGEVKQGGEERVVRPDNSFGGAGGPARGEGAPGGARVGAVGAVIVAKVGSVGAVRVAKVGAV